jgi:hypothetical protein
MGPKVLRVVDQPHPHLSLDGRKSTAATEAQQSMWNCPEGGDPLGRDIDGEQRSLNFDSRV